MMAELSRCSDCMAHKAENIHYLKKCANPRSNIMPSVIMESDTKYMCI